MGERVFFKVTGTHTVYLTGNYVIPLEDGDQTDESDSEDGEGYYDLSPDEDELDLMDEDDESDALDDIENPRITEVGSDEEETSAKVSKKGSKGKNKRPADDSDEEMSLDDMMGKALKPADQPTTNGEQKLSKKQQKKLKKNNGEAVEVKGDKSAKDTAGSKTDKKVQFAKDLEQGPTGSAHKKDSQQTGTLGVKEVQGVKIDDKKLGKGRQVKSGDRVAMRYIGKLDDGKVFDGE